MTHFERLCRRIATLATPFILLCGVTLWALFENRANEARDRSEREMLKTIYEQKLDDLRDRMRIETDASFRNGEMSGRLSAMQDRLERAEDELGVLGMHHQLRLGSNRQGKQENQR